MKTENEVFLDGEKIELPEEISEDVIDDDLRLLDEEMPTEDLSEFLENTKELDWSKNE